jgi:hemoglobin-like flavoprotein
MTPFMTPHQIELVQKSFAQVAPIAATAADLFYARLFATAPELRPLFPDDLGEQKKKLMAMLGTVVTGLPRFHTLMPAVRALGRRHKDYGVTSEHFYPVGAALIWTLQKGLGDSFTEEVADAWVTVYATISKAMMEAAAEQQKAA